MDNLGKVILNMIGGEDNVKNITHCATRLRFTFYDNSKVDVKSIRELDGVVGVVEGGQFQIIIGINVGTVYKELIKDTNLENKEDELICEKKKPLASFLDIVVSLFTPLLPLLAGSGLLRGFVILATQIGILNETSSTYIILTSASTAVFHFLPVLLALTTAKKFNANIFVSVAIMGALIMPEFEGLMANGGVGTRVTFMGLPIIMVQYTGSVVPAVCAIFCQAKLEKFLKKHISKSLHMIVIPTISLFLIVPITAGIFGPFGVYLGMGIANMVNWLLGLNGIIMGAIIAGIWNILIMFGIHWAVNTTVVIPNIALVGESQIIALAAGANFGMAGACLGVFLKTRSKRLKGYATTSIVSIFLSGIVEPAIYGIGLKYKRPLIAGIIASALGGALMGAFQVVGYSFVFGGITTIPAFAGPKILYYILGLIVAFVSGTVLTIIFGFKDDIEEKDELANNMIDVNDTKILSPLKGEICNIEDVKDKAFATKSLGDGIAIIPTMGELVAPFDGIIEAIFPTKHAIGLISNSGVELLIHIGFDTINLNGKYFESHVQQGQAITVGQKLISFDMDKIEKCGYDMTTAIVITNSDIYKQICKTEKSKVDLNDYLIKAKPNILCKHGKNKDKKK